ncbi:MAG: zinc ABC transporter substrate-binding protein, partial [Paracoccus denitrificans]
EHSHHHHGVDPHAWLNPQNAALWLDAIAADLVSKDPDNAATYKSNADAAKAKVDALDKELATELAGAKDKPFIVYHDAYGYFTDHYGLPAALAVTGGSGGAPSAAQLSEIKAAAQSGVTCAFPEANHDARLINAAIEQSGVRLGGALDPEGSKVTQGPDLYLDVMKNLGKNITDCIAGK